MTEELMRLAERVEELEAQVAVFDQWAGVVCDAADDLLAPICAEAGRVMTDMPEENMTPHLPELPARLFRALYEATDPERRATLTEKGTKG